MAADFDGIHRSSCARDKRIGGVLGRANSQQVSGIVAGAERNDRQRCLRFTREQNTARHLVHRSVAADRCNHVVVSTRLTSQRHRLTRAIGNDVVRLNPVRCQFNQQFVPSPPRTTCRRAEVGD